MCLSKKNQRALSSSLRGFPFCADGNPDAGKPEPAIVCFAATAARPEAGRHFPRRPMRYVFVAPAYLCQRLTRSESRTTIGVRLNVNIKSRRHGPGCINKIQLNGDVRTQVIPIMEVQPRWDDEGVYLDRGCTVGGRMRLRCPVVRERWECFTRTEKQSRDGPATLALRIRRQWRESRMAAEG